MYKPPKVDKVINGYNLAVEKCSPSVNKTQLQSSDETMQDIDTTPIRAKLTILNATYAV